MPPSRSLRNQMPVVYPRAALPLLRQLLVPRPKPGSQAQSSVLSWFWHYCWADFSGGVADFAEAGHKNSPRLREARSKQEDIRTSRPRCCRPIVNCRNYKIRRPMHFCSTNCLVKSGMRCTTRTRRSCCSMRWRLDCYLSHGLLDVNDMICIFRDHDVSKTLRT